MEFQITRELPGEAAAIGRVHDAAFGGGQESLLVDRLRGGGDLVLSLVAQVDHEIAGHLAFSRLRISGGRPVAAVSLAPLGVVPAHQANGIGTALVACGLAVLADLHEQLVLVLGEPDYYRRFGFSPGPARRFVVPWRGDAFQALWLDEPVPDCGVMVHYPSAFAALEE